MPAQSGQGGEVTDMGSTLTVAEAARLIGRTTEATRKLIGRYGVEKIREREWPDVSRANVGRVAGGEAK